VNSIVIVKTGTHIASILQIHIANIYINIDTQSGGEEIAGVDMRAWNAGVVMCAFTAF
jgi:hypothetical protein